MKTTNNCCVYCERTALEVVEAAQVLGAQVEAEEALSYVIVNGSRILLCLECGADKTKLTSEEELALIYAPIDLPEGVTTLEHTCPMKLYDGFSEEEATSIVELQREGGYFVGSCPECGMQVRSKAVEPAS